MQADLIECQAVDEDALIVNQIQSSMITAIKNRKIELAIAALSSLNSHYTRKNILSTPSFVDSVALIRRMSPGGKLCLAQAILEQINA